MYNPSPGKSYIIEPHEGEINYKLAHKNPLKFYDQVLSQDITKIKCGKDKEFIKQEEEKHKQKEEEAGSPLKRKKTKAPLAIS